MSFNLDLQADQSNIPASKGIHVAECVKVEQKVSQQGNDMLVFSYDIKTPGEEGKRVWDRVVTTPKMAWKYTQVFSAFGLTPGKKGFEGITEKSFLGKKVRLAITHDDYEGVARAQVDSVLPLGDGKPRIAVSDDEAQAVLDGTDDTSVAESSLPF